MNELRKIGNVDYNFKLQDGLKNIESENIDDLVLEINNIEKDTIDISAFSKAINRLLDEMEIEFRESIFNSINIKGKMDLNCDTVESLEKLIKFIDDIDIESSPELIKEDIESLKTNLKEIVKSNIDESKNLIKLLKSYDGRDLLKDIDIKDKVEKSSVIETRSSFIELIKKEILELESAIKNGDIHKNLSDKIERDIKLLKDSIEIGSNEDNLCEEDKVILRELKYNLSSESSIVKEKIDGIIKFLKDKDGELSSLLGRSLDNEDTINDDSMFKKFKVDGDLDFKDNLYIDVFREREKRLKEIEEDIIIKKIYRDGRKDLNLSLSVSEIFKNIRLEFKDILYITVMILITVFILNRVF